MTNVEICSLLTEVGASFNSDPRAVVPGDIAPFWAAHILAMRLIEMEAALTD